jgi:hypothetical protein
LIKIRNGIRAAPYRRNIPAALTPEEETQEAALAMAGHLKAKLRKGYEVV